MWSKIGPVLADKLKKTPGTKAIVGVRAHEIDSTFPDDLLITAARPASSKSLGGFYQPKGMRIHKHPETGEMFKAHHIHVIFPTGERDFKKSVETPHMHGVFAHEHEHYNEYLEDEKTNGTEQAVKSYLHSVNAIKLLGMTRYYTDQSEIRARQVQYAIQARKGGNPEKELMYHQNNRFNRTKTGAIKALVDRHLENNPERFKTYDELADHLRTKKREAKLKK